MTGFRLALATTIGFSFWQPAFANDHCGAVLDTVDEILKVLKSQSASCETALESARALMEVGREHAAQCGCADAADNFGLRIEASKSPEYSCANKSRGLETLRSGMGDIVGFCYGG